jgi:hypothetical protein
MQVWKRRVVVLLAVGAGSAGLMMSSAGAQTSPPTSIPTFTIPDFPDFPDFTVPTFPPFPTIPTIPPPTMPPTSTPPTSTPPPTMPPITIPPDVESDFEDIISRIEEFGDDFSELVDEIRNILDSF